MRAHRPTSAVLRPSTIPVTVLAVLLAAALATPSEAARRRASHEAVGTQLFASPQANPVAATPDGSRVYVANTTSRTVDVIDTATLSVVATIEVGIDPVAVAVRPDGNEVWVANHVSDSVSVIDSNPASASFHVVVETVQDLESPQGATRFDEPVGIAFASNQKAYVALSSRNQIAVVDATTYTVTGTIDIGNQDPRAIAVRGDRLFVTAFESGNQSVLSVCLTVSDPPDPKCSFDFFQVMGAATSPNLPGIPKNVVRDTIAPRLPDRDLFVIDTATDTEIENVRRLGTLLYGIAVSQGGQVFVTNTDARNHDEDGNGLAAPPPAGLSHGLADLENRAFRNRITRVDCGGASCTTPVTVDLEPDVGQAVPTPLATPYGVALSADDSTLVVTAAASSRVATVDASTLSVLDTLDVGAIPRGVAFVSVGATGRAWVLDTLGNTVSVVDVAPGGGLVPVTTIPVGDDPTPTDVRLGRIAFNDATGSSSGTFACASCHPDAGVDQLLWVIGSQCDDCEQEDQRSTMPVRGLRHTLPLHWDGSNADPFGGPNGETGIGGNVAPNCSLGAGGDEQPCFRQLVDASLSGVMCEQPGCPNGPSGLPGRLTAAERENMARFLQSVAYAPARARRIDDAPTSQAIDGYADFFLNQGGNGGNQASTCADTTGGCHALPLGVSTNSIVVGAFDSPTMRGMTDRFLQFSGGFTNSQEAQDIAFGVGQSQGVHNWRASGSPVMDELVVFSVGFVAFNPAYNVFPDDMFQMFEETSTGFSGATGRQLTLNTQTALLPDTVELMTALQDADLRGVVNLRAVGIRNGNPITLSFQSGGTYQSATGGFVRAPGALRSEAAAGTLLVTLTAAPRAKMGDPDWPQPLLAPDTTGTGPSGNDPDIPELPGDNPMTLQGIDVRQGATLHVDGARVAGTVACQGGSFSPFCTSQVVTITLDDPPVTTGLHVLQVQNPSGPISNEMPICVGDVQSDCE